MIWDFASEVMNQCPNQSYRQFFNSCPCQYPPRLFHIFRSQNFQFRPGTVQFLLLDALLSLHLMKNRHRRQMPLVVLVCFVGITHDQQSVADGLSWQFETRTSLIRSLNLKLLLMLIIKIMIVCVCGRVGRVRSIDCRVSAGNPCGPAHDLFEAIPLLSSFMQSLLISTFAGILDQKQESIVESSINWAKTQKPFATQKTFGKHLLATVDHGFPNDPHNKAGRPAAKSSASLLINSDFTSDFTCWSLQVAMKFRGFCVTKFIWNGDHRSFYTSPMT